MRPRDCRSEKDLLRCRTDNAPLRNDVWSILNGEDHVSLHGPSGQGYVTIPRKEFNTIVDWYNRDQKPIR